MNAATYDTFSAFGIAAVLYAVLAFILIWIFRKLENVGWHFKAIESLGDINGTGCKTSDSRFT